MASPARSNVIRFGAYEFAQFAGELRKEGIRVRLEGQPLAILKILLERPGELVAREQLQKKLWPADTFVDFEHSLNAAVDGTEMGMSGVCLEITPPERLVATEKFDQPWYPGRATGTITLTEACGLTTLTQTIRYDSQAARDMVLQTPIEHAVALGYDRLAELLKSQMSDQEVKK